MKNYISQFKISMPDWKNNILMGVVFSFIFAIIALLNFRSYESTVTILVVSKSDIAVINHDKIVSNIVELPRTLNFYKRLLSNNNDLSESDSNKSDLEKKESWNEVMKIKRSPKNSSIIEITIVSNNEKNAEKIASKTARTLFDLTSSYYNVKTDLDLRLIEGPIVKNSYKNWPFMISVSILLGFALAFVLQSAMIHLREDLDLIGKIKKGNLEFWNKKETENMPKESFKEDIAKVSIEEISQEPQIQSEEKTESEKRQKDEEWEKLNKMIQSDIYPNFPEMPKNPKKASAPDNLPIGESSFFMEEEYEQPKEEQKIETQENETQQDIQREPTQEEIKDRLNKLLKGK